MVIFHSYVTVYQRVTAPIHRQSANWGWGTFGARAQGLVAHAHHAPVDGAGHTLDEWEADDEKEGLTEKSDQQGGCETQ